MVKLYSLSMLIYMSFYKQASLFKSLPCVLLLLVAITFKYVNLCKRVETTRMSMDHTQQARKQRYKVNGTGSKIKELVESKDSCSSKGVQRRDISGITHDSKHSLPGSHRGEYSRFYALQRGTPTSTVSTNSTQALAEQCSFTR
jgi:hypothetical protein